ncbi:MAG: F-type H+/Na+-transporting ATPase subunit alpha [Clostridiales bacterium]|jgi:F-type H+-transporting ATPase subunit alpha|nr:F-type H+/Na+-transporting ATPase subunit alpha [Clostridiales bacterium]
MSDTGFKVIRIVSAIDMDSPKGESIAARFAEHFGITEYSVRLEKDVTLIGGMIIYAGGFRYDYSIKGQLARISNNLKNQKSIGADGETDVQDANDLIKDNLAQALNLFDEMPIAPDGQDLFWNSEALSTQDDNISGNRIVDNLRENLEMMGSSSTVDEIGQVLSVSDNVAYVSGMQNCRSSELIMFSRDSYGIAMNLEEDRIGVIVLQDDDSIGEGSICKRTGTTASVPVGKAMLGRVVDPLGKPLDGLGHIPTDKKRPIEFEAASIIDRQPVNQSLHTGITAIDAMTPIGRGQRELIIGDRQTGKTTIAIDTILNQKGKNVYCIYVAIGQNLSTVANIVNNLQQHGAMDYTTVVVASASTSAAMQYMAPFSGCAMAEGLMYEDHEDVLIVYDDLTKHAQAYRAISLLLRRPPGREAYPGDVFYLHSRLLERAAHLSDRLGGGSMTALPIIETQSGDISAYIPTNVISITDGQIYLESELFYSGQRPAVNVGLSVSRVGGAAQSKAMKKVAGPLRINLAQYRELEAFSQFGSELDDATQRQLRVGERLIEVLKQPPYSPLAMEDQVVMLYLANKGVLTSLDKEDVKIFLTSYITFMRDRHPVLMEELAGSQLFTDAIAATIDSTIKEYLKLWQLENEDNGADI